MSALCFEDRERGGGERERKSQVPGLPSKLTRPVLAGARSDQWRCRMSRLSRPPS